MAFISGATGSVVVSVLDASHDLYSQRTWHVVQWTLTDEALPAEVPHVAASGFRVATMGYRVSWSFTLPIDDTELPASVFTNPSYSTATAGSYGGIYAGQPTCVWFKVGTASLWHRVRNTMVMAMTPVCNSAGDVIRLTVTGSGGEVDYYVGNTTHPAAVSNGSGGTGLGIAGSGGTGTAGGFSTLTGGP